MESSHWHHVKHILAEVLDEAPEKREAFLQDACNGNDALLKDVQTLIAAYDEGATFFAQPINNPAPPPAKGDKIGRYKLLERIGQGGMGVIHRALRDDDQFQREVALKILSPSALTSNGKQRFIEERQILARLEHPSIARLYDGGITSSGQPYFAMERVDGMPIDEYCDTHELSVDARIRLFIQAARAVAYAHQQLIVHRDLKPDHILITRDGQVKLLDFGIAKLLHPNHEAPITQTALSPMTPRYAAPEQLQNKGISTATDVYALGLILFELLTGQRPYQLQGKSLAEVEATICDEPPLQPSRCVADMNQKQIAEISERRSSLPSQLQRKLRGDLDTIILKAIRKKPSRRYGSATQLARDLERYLNGLPVSAQPDSLAYRSGKFIQRYRWSVAVTATITLLIVTYALTVTIQAKRIADERDRAQFEAEKAEQVTAFLTDLFRQPDVFQFAGSSGREARVDMSVADALDRGAARIKTSLHDQPLVRSALMEAIGAVYTNLGRYDEAKPLLLEALETRQLVQGPNHPDLATPQNRLGYLLYRQGEFEAAIELQSRAAELLQSADRYSPIRHASLLNSLGLIHDERGAPDEAEALFREALEINTDTTSSLHTTLLHNLAISLQDQQRYSEALPLHRRALERWQAYHNGPHPQIASALARMAFTLHRMGEVEQAVHLQRSALEMRRMLLPDNHPHVASSQVRLGWALVEAGEPLEAESLIQDGLETLEMALPASHWQISAARGLLGVSLTAQQRFEEAEPLLTDAYRALHSEFGDDDWRTENARNALLHLHQMWEESGSSPSQVDSLLARH